MGTAVWTAVVMPPGAWSPRRCRGACAVRAATLEPGPPNERSAAHPTRRVSPTFRQASRKSGRRSACMAARTHNAFVRPVHSKTDRERTHGQALFAREDLHADAPLHTFRRRSRRHAWAKPCLAATTYNARTARSVPRAIAKARMGEALFGGPTHDARTNAASREEHLAWPPVWDGAS
jgi:hypothetical protein